MKATRERGRASKCGDFEPEHALLGGVLRQACRDALQTANERLRVEAWEFLDVCAPYVAERLRRQQGQSMAAWFDLKHRVERLVNRGYIVSGNYKGDGLPKWLSPALEDCDIYVLNVKSIRPDDTLCIVRLARLEKLLENLEER